VGPAHQPERPDVVATPEPERHPVVELEAGPLGTPPARGVPVAALPAVSGVNGTPHRRRDVARHRRRPRVGERLSRRLHPRETPRLQPLDLLGDGLFDDRGQVPVGDRGAHERSQALELVAQRGAGRELHPVTAGGQGLDASGGRRGGGRG
jgi:hypothetical protein